VVFAGIIGMIAIYLLGISDPLVGAQSASSGFWWLSQITP
jgi:hypothetical protein